MYILGTYFQKRTQDGPKMVQKRILKTDHFVDRGRSPLFIVQISTKSVKSSKKESETFKDLN
jgi:hypothetical protein